MIGNTQRDRTAIDRMVVTAHKVEVPLDWSDPDKSERITVFAREVIAAEKKDDPSLPAICWFQGGPGFEIAYPESRNGWLEQLITRYKVVLLDQRGTGLSTPLDARALPRDDVPALLAYLRNFRADSIIRDADRVRAAMYGEDSDWHIFGQSFGGFCALSYLSFIPTHVKAAIITGGFAPVLHNADSVYESLADRLAERNAQYYEQFPSDVGRVRRILDHLESTADVDSHGNRLSGRRFLAVGEHLGHVSGFGELHGLVERAANDLDQLGVLSGFVHSHVADVMAPATNPIYSVLHEACYQQGEATRWAADRVITKDPRFGLDAKPVPCFTGEMIFPWMFEELPPLRPLREVAEALAALDGWPPLYDRDRLRANTVPTVGTVYWGDPYVDRNFALETAELVGNCDVWITNEYEHGAYRADPKRVADRLFAMLDQRKAET
jgi:pimeloyl-ACP methyl ester carboxylesterase